MDGVIETKVVAIIQARTGSTRLPGKVLMDIAGKPMLWHVIERIKRCRTIDQVVVATTVKEEDKKVIELARKCGVETFAGSEDDVLDRYYQAAKRFKADIVVRITSDCPLIDPIIVDKVVDFYEDNKDKTDYVCTAPSFPDGVDTEVFSFNALETAWRDAKKRYEREHVTMYMHENPAIFRLDTIENNKDMSHIRFTVDRKDDLTAVREIFKNLYKEDNVFYMQDIVNLLEEKTEIMELNKNIPRNEGFLRSLEKEGIDIEDTKAPFKEWVDKYAFRKNNDLVSKRIKFLVIGCGSIGKRHIRNLKSLGYNDIIAYDVKEERSKEVEEYNVTTFDILDDAFSQKIDAVLVCTPSSLHLQPALLAVEHGCHVFIEKPISHNLDGLDELIDVAEEKSVVTMVGFNMRFEKGLKQVKKLLDEKAIGKVTSAICIAGQYLPDQHPWEDYRQGYAANKSLGGGIILDGIHELDYLSWFLGDIKEIVCFADKLSSLEMDTEDTAAYLLRFENSAIGIIQMDYVKRRYERTCEIIGEEGIIKWDFKEHTVKLFSAKKGEWETIQYYKECDIDKMYVDEMVNKMYVDEMNCFIDCINGKRSPPVDAVNGKKILEVTLGANESSDTKKVITL